MADVVKQVDYYYTTVPNQPGEGARIFANLKEAGVNLVAFIGFPLGEAQAQLDMVPADREAFLKAAAEADIKLVGPKTAFLIQGEDQPGALVDVMQGLEKAGINATAVHAIASGGKRFGAILWVKPHDTDKAARALGAN